MKKTLFLILFTSFWSIAFSQEDLEVSRLVINKVSDNYILAIGNSKNHHLIGTYPGWDVDGIYIAGYNKTNLSTASTKNVYIGKHDFKFDLVGKCLELPSLKLKKSGDNVLSCAGNSRNHHLIGTYPGWDADGVYIAGYNNSNLSTTSTKNVYIGRGDFKFDLVNKTLGIGTQTTGSHKLAVNGSIGAREVTVEAGTWSDFVFDDDYELRSLEEVESYIAENKHLPEIPNEDEVGKNGIKLGEMNAKLLQKVEELTLYMIEMNREIKELKAKNAELEKRLGE